MRLGDLERETIDSDRKLTFERKKQQIGVCHMYHRKSKTNVVDS